MSGKLNIDEIPKKIPEINKKGTRIWFVFSHLSVVGKEKLAFERTTNFLKENIDNRAVLLKSYIAYGAYTYLYVF